MHFLATSSYYFIIKSHQGINQLFWQHMSIFRSTCTLLHLIILLFKIIHINESKVLHYTQINLLPEKVSDDKICHTGEAMIQVVLITKKMKLLATSPSHVPPSKSKKYYLTHMPLSYLHHSRIQCFFFLLSESQ